MDVKLYLLERALEDWMHKEDIEPSDNVARSFRHHLEYLTITELRDVFWLIHWTDELREGWHSLDRIYETRARRETEYNRQRRR
ncbi:hypothetical protein D3C86_1542850 [compost metagenome]